MEHDTKDRQIRIFISSTFKDMNEERDYLIKKVFPRLQAEAAKRDVIVVPVDLRWGVTEEESKTGKVIQICLQEIENSHPFFIGLIGGRYGWCPTMEEVEKNEYLKDNWGEWLEKDIKNGLSVTEIEMQYGVLRRRQNKKKEPFYKRWFRKERSDDGNDRLHAYFYIRKNSKPDLENADKLQRLKDGIRKNSSYPVYDYDSPESLGQQVEKDFITLLDRLYSQKSLSRLEKEQMAQTAFLKSRTSIYIPTISNMEVLDAFLLDREKRNLVITGESGMGKSALLANWILRHENDSRYNIVYHFVGYGGGTENSQHILEHMNDEIRSCYKISQKEEDNNRNLFEQLEYAYSQIYDQKPFLIVLDGINQLSDVDDAKLLNWLPNPPRNGKMLFSTIESDRTMQTFKIRKYDVCGMTPLDKDGKKEFVNKYLLKFSKKLADEQANRIVNDSQNENMHALQTLLSELVSFGLYEKLDQQIDYYLKAESLEDFYNLVLERYERDYGRERIQAFLALIAFSQYGLSETELLGLTHEVQLHWSQFFCAFKYQLLNKNGLLAFSHQQIRNAVLARYHNEEKRYRHQIIDFFERNQNSRSLEELPYQYYQLGDPDKLYKTLTDRKVLRVLLSKDTEGFGLYWAWLRKIDPAKYPIEVYLDMLTEEDINTVDLCIRLSNVVGSDFTMHEMQLQLNLRAIEILNHSKEKNIPYQIRCTCELGFVYHALHKNEKAIETYLQALDLARPYYGDGSVTVASIYCKLGSVSKTDAAKEYYERAIRIIESMKVKEKECSIIYAEACSKIGNVYVYNKDNEKAYNYLRKALDIYLPLWGEQCPFVWSIYNNIAKIYDNQADYLTELDWLTKSLEVQNSIYHERNAHYAVTLDNFGCALFKLDRYKEALYYHTEALKLREKYLGICHPETASNYNNIAIVYFYLRDFDSSLDYLKKAYDAYSSTYSDKLEFVKLQIERTRAVNIPMLFLSKKAILTSMKDEFKEFLINKEISFIPSCFEYYTNEKGGLEMYYTFEKVGLCKFFVCFTHEDDFKLCDHVSSVLANKNELVEYIILKVESVEEYTPLNINDSVQWIGDGAMTARAAVEIIIEHILQFDKLRKELVKECRSILERSRFDSMSISELEQYVKESESPNAGMDLGCRYIAGTEVPHDIHKGINTFLTTAANGGEGPVGIWCFLDKYIGLFNCQEIDRLKDIAWKYNSPYAAYLYAHCSELRRGSKSCDINKVIGLYKTAANMGNPKAKEALNRLTI